MICMLQRKMPSVFYRKRTEWITQLLMQLISLKPYIKLTDSEENVLDRLEEICEPQFEIYQCNPAWAVDIFRHSILFYWEPQFHPLIREGHMELLKTLAHELAFAEGSKPFEPLEPHVDDFLEHLRPYAYMHVKRKKEEYGYFKAEEQVRWHEVFDKYLASGALDHRMNEFSCLKDGFVHTIVADFKGCPFEKLDHDLIRMSFERRARIVERECQMSCYFECLASLLDNDEMKQKLGSLMSLLSTEGFFRVDDDSIDWVVRDAKYLWKGYLEEFWLETSYTHEYYEIVSKPLQKQRPDQDPELRLSWRSNSIDFSSSSSQWNPSVSVVFMQDPVCLFDFAQVFRIH
ncbi:hypothetical protein EJB05_27739 [Eragrostis curvula]|uniref:Uncharacterized protein n=1 Tax=Eragrostis curvula TaxID=38414 RepID=A0A5J9UN40_9POAL|nr:hypothetical protein EJB05_27739 [Eragrostis curvula]